MSIINLDQFRSIKRETSAPSYSCFVERIYAQNAAVFEALWLEHIKKHTALAKDTIIKPMDWHYSEWACSKITLNLNAAVRVFDTYNYAIINNMDLTYYKQRAEQLLITFDGVLTQLESFEYKYHYHNAVAVSQLVIETLKQIKQL